MRSRTPVSNDDRGSSPVEFVLVGALLTLLTLGVLQFGLIVYVRNVVHDAAVEGAYRGALADQTVSDGASRTRDLIAHAVGSAYAEDVTATRVIVAGQATIRMTVRAPLPLAGLLGVPRVLEVSADAPVETLG